MILQRDQRFWMWLRKRPTSKTLRTHRRQLPKNQTLGT